MATASVPYGQKTQRAPAVKEVHILWITAGLSCDGDSVSITAAMQPSIEDVLLGAIPGLPKVHLHNPVLAYEVGDDFMKYWYAAEQGRLEPFVPVHEGCDRAGYYEQGQFTDHYGAPECLVKIGCWGPVVNCNVTKRGWMGGIGGCPNVGGICIGCTMPGFPDKFMPFMDQPPGAKISTNVVSIWGGALRALRKLTNDTVNKEPSWRHTGRELTTGYRPSWRR